MHDPADHPAEAGIGPAPPPGKWPFGGTEMAARVRNYEWRTSPLGPVDSWPEHLRHCVQWVLDSVEPSCLLWTAAGIHIYNDAYMPILHLRHPAALGGSLAQVWPESAQVETARHAEVLRTGVATVTENLPQVIFNRGIPRERYFTVSATPVRGPTGRTDGVIRRLFDTTEHAQTQRRLRQAISELGQQRAAATMRLALSDVISDENARQSALARTELQDREERLRLAIVAGRLATWDWDVETGKIVWSDQMYPMYGYSPDEIKPSFAAWAKRVHPDDLPGLLEALERARGRCGDFVHRFRIVHPDGSIHWCSARGRYFFKQPGRLRMLAVAQDVTDEHRAQLRLHDIELQQRALIEGVPQMIWRADSRGLWTWSSPQWTRVTGLSLQESLGEGWLTAVHPDDRPRARAAWQGAADKGVFDVEYRIGPSGTGVYRWFQTRATPIRNEEHGVIEWLGTSTDIDELRQAREGQKLLVAELQHRTRNLIGVIRALSNITSRECGSLQAFQVQFGERLAALSRAQGLLSRAEAEPITVQELLKVELDALGAERLAQHISIEGPKVQLQNSVVQTFALAIHELATNALKYGALRTPDGRLEVSWRLETNSTNGSTLHLHWHEMGAAGDTPPGPTGYGRELLEQMLPYVLDAKTQYWLTPAGAQCKIELPVRFDAATGWARIVAVQ